MNYVIIVDPFSSGKLLASRINKRGYYCVAIQSNPKIAENKTIIEKDFIAIYTYSGEEIISFASKITQELSGKPVAVICGYEGGVELADRLAAIWELSGNNYLTSKIRRDKYEMHQALKKNNIAYINQFRTADYLLAQDWVKTNGIDSFVVKPVNSAGTENVFFSTKIEDMQNFFNKILSEINMFGLRSNCAIVQERLYGDEYVVDAVSCKGKHYITDVFRYKKVIANGSDFIYRDMSILPVQDYLELTGYIKKLSTF